MSNFNSINNNGVPYYFPADIAKEGQQYARFSNWLKTRVNDNGKKVPVKWYDQGRVMNVNGLTPFIRGMVGHFTTDENDELIPSSDVVSRDWQGSTADVTDGGLAFYTLEDQFFCQEGQFKGVFGLRDSNGNVYTSVNIVFEILGNDLRMGETTKYYSSKLDKMVQEFSVRTDQAVKEFNAKIEAGTANDQAALDALRASIQANRDEQANLSQRLVGTEQQIATQDIVTKAQHDNSLKEISDAINQRLAVMKTTPIPVSNVNILMQENPSGADGIFLTQDTKHLYTYLNGAWQDLGPYQAVELDKETVEAINDTKSIALGSELISNGGFGTGSPAPAYPATLDTNLAVNQYLGRNWLNVSSEGTSQWKGVQWNIDKQNNEVFGYPLELSFDIQSVEKKTVSINVLYFDANNNRLSTQSLPSLTLTPYRFNKYDEVFNLDRTQRDCASLAIQIITDDDKPIQKFLISAMSLKVIFSKNDYTGSNLISNSSFDNGFTDPAYPTTSDTNLSLGRYAGRNWLNVSSEGTSQWKGVQWNIDKQNNEVFGYPLELSFDIQSVEKKTVSINVLYFDANNNRLSTQNLPQLTLSAYRFKHYNYYFKLDPNYNDCASLAIQIITEDDKPIQKILLTDINLEKIFDDSLSKEDGNLLSDYPWGERFTLDTTTSFGLYLRRYWQIISGENNSQWKGIKYQINTQNGEIFGYPLRLSFDIQSAESRSLAINIAYFDKNHQNIGMENLKSCDLDAWRFTHYQTSKILDGKYRDCAYAELQLIFNEAQPLKTVMLSPVTLSPVFDYKKEKVTEYGLPVLQFSGDLSGISKDDFKNITWEFTSKNTEMSGAGSIKWQGDSSTTYPKKAYRLKTLKSDYKTKDKVRFFANWKKHNKFNLKAYYTDGLISRDPVNAAIGTDIWATQKGVHNDLIREDSFGFINGFPCILIINNEFQGVYSFNLPRPDFDYTKYAIIGGEYNEQSQFKKAGVKLDGSDFESLNPDDEPNDDERKAVDDLINFVATTNDDEFKAHLAEHINLNSAIDYFIFSNLIDNGDAWGKNQVLLTWDGKIWYWQPYDLDATWAGEYDGSVKNLATDVNGRQHMLFDRISKLYLDEIKLRYTSLRSWLTPGYVLSKFRNRINEIGVDNFDREHAKWNNPAKDTEDYKQITEVVYHQFQLLDGKWLN